MTLRSKRRCPPAEIVCSPDIVGGVPTVRGTRIPVETILIHARAGRSRKEIVRHRPGRPLDGIEPCVAWAEKTLGPARRELTVAA